MDFPRRKALIYGDSVFLKGIADTLRILPDLEVMEACPKTINTLLADACPDVVFVDAAQMTSLQVESLLSTFTAGHSPSILRLDARNGKMTMLSAQQFSAASFTDLRQALENIFNLDSTKGEIHVQTKEINCPFDGGLTGLVGRGDHTVGGPG